MLHWSEETAGFQQVSLKGLCGALSELICFYITVYRISVLRKDFFFLNPLRLWFLQSQSVFKIVNEAFLIS